jgi:hypothetical protein
VKADFVSFYLAFASLYYISSCIFQINSILDILPWISNCVNWENQNGHSVVYQKEEVYLRLFYLLRYERLLHKCTEINAGDLLYSHFFCFSWKRLYFFIIVFYEIQCSKDFVWWCNYFLSGLFGMTWGVCLFS